MTKNYADEISQADLDDAAKINAQFAPLPDTFGGESIAPDLESAVGVDVLSWMPSGKTLRAYLTHPAPVSAIMGPNGSGKTTGSFIKALLCSMAVPPSPVDGVRYARGAIVRDTYRNLEFNTIPSWQERFPKTLGKWRGGAGGEPGQHTIDFKLDDGTFLHLEVLFVAVGDHNIKEFCDGLQVNWCFVNGLDVLPVELLMYMRPRLGRWPPPQHRPANWKQFVPYWKKFFADMNAPDLDNWTLEKLRDNPKPSYKFFEQPGGLDPDAENLENLDSTYYTDLLDNDDWWVQRFVNNKPGYSRAGKPIYTDYSDTLHVSKVPLKFVPGLTLHLGIDGGRDCCAIAGQKMHSERLNLLREFIPETRRGARQFGTWLAPKILDNFPGVKKIVCHLDPATFNPNDLDDDFVWARVFKLAFTKELDIAVSVPQPKYSNVFTVRKDAVDRRLKEVEAGVPMILLDPSIKVLRRGFASGYRYATTKSHGDEVLTDEPVKNQYSHPHDANQYLCLGVSNWREAMGLPQHNGGRGPSEEIGGDPFEYLDG